MSKNDKGTGGGAQCPAHLGKGLWRLHETTKKVESELRQHMNKQTSSALWWDQELQPWWSSQFLKW
jgi:hypothetical protein